ncbi:DUF4880 domain-containing protein [Sphingomonas sp. CL5.1]|uniref:FecR family protein n=1 Tax=Sphingomonas sp. CL5.1 TaxID=2653203 RepID=UPI001582D10A|nr:FecR domain-containing protein [Sphingomonas sp. CL5.1]QKS01682.1 DUF4880 domain-containing protein [Sphingomonas sp. CL5.1]
MNEIDDTILDAAIAWHVRQATMDERGWADFIAWLEADPRHARAYDVVSIGDAARHPPLVAANDDEDFAAPARRHRWRGVAIAASVLAATVVGTIGVIQQRGGGGTPLEVVANAPRSLMLADGTRIAMASGARVMLGGDRRSAAVESGRVTFRVTHDAGRPFTVRAGDWEIEDVGTIFSVMRGARGVDVGVSEGSVLFDPQNNRIALNAGEALTVLDGQRIVRSRIDSDEARTLVFSGQPIRFAAETIALVLGRDVRADDRVAATPFTGVVRLTGDAPRDMAHFAELTGMRVSHDGGSWIIAPSAGPAR